MARRECGLVFIRGPSMYGLDGCRPLANWMGRGQIHSCSPLLVDIICCPSADWRPQFGTTTWGFGKTSPFPFLQLLQVQKVQCSIYMCPGAHKFVFSPEAVKSTLTKKLDSEQVVTPPYSELIVHGYSQHARAEWCGKHCFRYHIYLISEYKGLLEVIILHGGWPVHCAVGNKEEDAEEVQEK